jgi:hypothetical protein
MMAACRSAEAHENADLICYDLKTAGVGMGGG